MTTRIGFAIVAGMLFLSGVFGTARLTATQEENSVRSASSDSTILNADAGVDPDSAVRPTDSATISASPAPSSLSITHAVVAGSRTVTESTTANRRKTGGAAEFSRSSAREAERKLNAMMSIERIPALNYPGDESLGEILRFLAEHLTETNGEILLILLDERDPDIGTDPEFLDSTTVSNVMLPKDSMSIASALDLIFAKVKDYELTWIAKDNVILITTVITAEDHLILRSYDIASLRDLKFPSEVNVPVAVGMNVDGGGVFCSLSDDAATVVGSTPAAVIHEPAQATNMQMGEVIEVRRFTWEESLVHVIVEMTSPPCHWIEEGDGIGSMSVVGDRLLVRQTRTGHENVVEVLDELEIAAGELDAATVPVAATDADE